MDHRSAATRCRLHVELTDQAIDLQPLRTFLADVDTGAHGWFEGVTRRMTGEQETVRLSYQAYAPMAKTQLRQLAEQAASEFDLRAVVIVHRLGIVEIGQASIVIGCCSPHRGGALAALPWLMDRIKADVAIWKQEQFVDGQSQWVHPQVSDQQVPRIYLDHAATGWPKPEAVYAAMDRFARLTGAPAGRGAYRSAAIAGEIVASCRRRLASLIGAQEPQRIAFFSNGTTALNAAILGSVGDGDHVVTTAIEHNSVLRPLQWLRDNRSVRVDIVRCDHRGAVDPAELLAKVTPQTCMVAFSHASNVTGTVQDIAAVGRQLQGSSTLLLCDAAQTLGYLEIDVVAMGIDLLAAPGHKGACGPLGTGMLYVSPKAQPRIRPTAFGGTGSVSESLQMPQSLPGMLEPGNLNVTAIAGWDAGLAALLSDDAAARGARIAALAAELQRALLTVPQIHLICGDRLPIASLTFPAIDASLLAALLDSEFGIEVRAGLHCAARIHDALRTSPGGTLRISAGHTTLVEEIQQVTAAIKEITEEIAGGQG